VANAVQPEVGGQDARVGGERRAGSRRDQPAGLEDVAAGGERERSPRSLLDEEDRDAAVVDPPGHTEGLALQHRRQTERRLVEQQEPGSAHESAADGEHLLLAARECPGELEPPFVEHRKELEGRFQSLAELGPSPGMAADEEVLRNRELREDLAPLRDVTDPAATMASGDASVMSRPS